MFKTKYFFSVLALLLIVSCNSDDDSSNVFIPASPTIEQLLISGKWYQETKLPIDFTECERSGYIEFFSTLEVTIETFDDNSGNCESTGQMIASYILNAPTISITNGADSFSVVINSITVDELRITTDDGDTIIFDRVVG